MPWYLDDFPEVDFLPGTWRSSPPTCCCSGGPCSTSPTRLPAGATMQASHEQLLEGLSLIAITTNDQGYRRCSGNCTRLNPATGHGLVRLGAVVGLATTQPWTLAPWSTHMSCSSSSVAESRQTGEVSGMLLPSPSTSLMQEFRRCRECEVRLPVGSLPHEAGPCARRLGADALR